jgi:hypothetical protein
MRYFWILALPFLLTGCLSAMMGGAGALAESGEDVEYYLKTHEVEPEVREAMLGRELTQGMTPTEVRLVMGDRTDYNARPDSVEETDGGERWLYENTDPMTPGTYEVVFSGDSLIRHGYAQ